MIWPARIQSTNTKIPKNPNTFCRLLTGSITNSKDVQKSALLLIESNTGTFWKIKWLWKKIDLFLENKCNEMAIIGI